MMHRICLYDFVGLWVGILGGRGQKNSESVLEPFEELTRHIGSATSLAADAIPAIAASKRLLAHENGTDMGIKTIKSTLHQAVNWRIHQPECDPIYYVVTSLDPLRKDRCDFGCYILSYKY